MNGKPLYRAEREREEDEAWKWVTGRPNNFGTRRSSSLITTSALPLIDEDVGDLDQVITWLIVAVVGVLAVAVSALWYFLF
jgi:hypothetical protein